MTHTSTHCSNKKFETKYCIIKSHIAHKCFKKSKIVEYKADDTRGVNICIVILRLKKYGIKHKSYVQNSKTDLETFATSSAINHFIMLFRNRTSSTVSHFSWQRLSSTVRPATENDRSDNVLAAGMLSTLRATERIAGHFTACSRQKVMTSQDGRSEN